MRSRRPSHQPVAGVPQAAIPVDDPSRSIGGSAGLGQSLCVYASKELGHAMQYLAWRNPRLHEGVHQARKSMRRVRATLALARDPLGRGGVLIDHELHRIYRSLSALRDGQALVEALNRLAKSGAASEHEGMLRRARRVAIRRRAEIGRLAPSGGADCTGHRITLGVLLAGMQALPWTVVTRADVERVLDECAEREHNARERALKSDRDADWHRWRRRVRRLTQEHRALDSVPLTIVKEHDKALTDLLGDMQDLSLLADRCGKHSVFPAADRRLLRTLAGKQIHRLRVRAARMVDSDEEQAG